MRAPMPETAVDKDCHLLARPRDVRMARNLPLQTVARQAGVAQALAHEQLGLGVGPLVALHGFSDGIACHVAIVVRMACLLSLKSEAASPLRKHASEYH